MIRFKCSADVAAGLLLSASLLLIVACDQNSGSSDAGTDTITPVPSTQTQGGIPKQRFHRPKTLAKAAMRMSELHEHLMSSDPLADPIKFEIVEVIHGTGAAAHSHYHLANDKDPDIHYEEDEKRVTHDYEVDVFTEQFDIARWLPRVAGDSDLDEEDWTTVNELSRKLVEAMEGSLASDHNESEKRSGYKAVGTRVEALIKQLRTVAMPGGEVEEPTDG